jgi:hypothetical protein
MNRALKALTSAALALCLTLGLLVPGALAGEGEATIVYTPESEAAFQQQLATRKIQSAIVNKRLRTVRLTLKDGTHVLAKYPKHQEPQTVARLKARGAAVTVLAKKQAEKEAAKKKGKHHKIRYIVGGVLIVVILLVGGALLYRRRGTRD